MIIDGAQLAESWRIAVAGDVIMKIYREPWWKRFVRWFFLQPQFPAQVINSRTQEVLYHYTFAGRRWARLGRRNG